MARKENTGLDDEETIGQKPEEASVVYVSQFDPLNPDAPAGPSLAPVKAARSKYWKHMSKPIKCDIGGSHSKGTLALARVHVFGKGNQNLCERHYNSRLNNPDSYDPNTIKQIHHDDPEQVKDINDEDWRSKTLDPKNRDAKLTFEQTGAIISPPRTPGRPVLKNRNPDTRAAMDKGQSFIQNTIDTAETGGGHIRADHEDLLDKAHKALVHSTQETGSPNPSVYRAKALELGVPKHRLDEYLAHAIAKHRKLTKKSIVPAPAEGDKMRRIELEAELNPSDRSSVFDEMTELSRNSATHIQQPEDEFMPGPKASSPRYD